MENKALIDANVFVARALVDDSLYYKAIKLFSNLIESNVTMITNEYVVYESFTVATIRSKNLRPAHLLNEKIFVKKSGLEIIRIPKPWDNEILTLFLNQNQYKGDFLSYIDCSLIIQARKLHINAIATFDETFSQFSKEFAILRV